MKKSIRKKRIIDFKEKAVETLLLAKIKGGQDDQTDIVIEDINDF